MRDFSTAAVHADDHIADLPDVAPAIRPSTTFTRIEGGRVYRRGSHETTERLEAVLGALEGGHAVVYPSGMAAVAAVLRHFRPRRIALPDDVYHGVRSFVQAGEAHGDWSVVPIVELAEGDIRWIETPSNPRCLITGLAEAAGAATERGVLTIVDATFATPVFVHPLGLGVDVVVHASTKFIAGHSDAMGGVVAVGDADVATALRQARSRDGAVPGSLETWLTLRGVRTLPLRMMRQSESAGEIAQWLVGRVDTVWYPGLPDHPGHEIAAGEMSEFGAVVSFEVSSPERAGALVSALKLFRNATSLGGVESLAEHRRVSDPAAPPGLIRLSIGVEAPADLIADLEQAMAATIGVGG